MDALSHALIAVIIFLAAGSTSSLIPFAVIGAVIVDADIFFRIISDRVPELYIFTHGGFAHSIPGAVAVSALGTSGIMLAVIAGAVPAWVLSIPLPLAFFAILAVPVFTWVSMHSRIRVFHCCIHYQTARSRSAYFRSEYFSLHYHQRYSCRTSSGQVNTPGALAFASAVFILFLVFRALLFLFARQKLPEG